MFSRRAALRGGTAAVALSTAAITAAGAVAARIVVESLDATLLQLVASFYETTEAYKGVEEAHSKARRRAEALPGYPGHRAGYGVWKAFMDAQGVSPLSDQWNALGVRRGDLALKIFGTPAETLRGTIEKLRIARLAIGDGGDEYGDHDLEVFQDYSAPWMGSVIRDLERLAGRAQS